MRVIAVLLIGLGLAGLAACNKPAPGAAVTGDMSLGSPSAKVTVIEYASLGCPICAKWNNEVFGDFKAKYVDSGKVRYVLREFLTGDAPIASAGFLLARCAGKDKYFQVVDAVWRQEAPYLEDPNKHAEERDALVKIAQSAGLTEPQFEACVTDEKSINALNDKVQRYVDQDKVNSTPTFVINGKVYDKGGLSMADMDKAIADAAAGAK